VLYPPIEFNKYKCKSEDFYLFVGRLWPEKRPEEIMLDLVKANKKIKIIGRGDLEEKIKKKIRKTSKCGSPRFCFGKRENRLTGTL